MFFHLLSIGNFWFYLIEFVLAAALVLLAGGQLTKYGDKIASSSNLSHGWIGFILLASITSLPELMTGISAAAVVGNVDLIVSDTIGSNAVNICILAAMFFFARKAIHQIKIEELLTGYAGLLLTTIVGGFIIVNIMGRMTNQNIISLSVSIIFSVVLFIIYLAIVFIAFKTGGLEEEGEEEEIKATPEKFVGLKFAGFSLIIIVASVWMTKTADHIALAPIGAGGFVLGQTFVGALLLAIATSLPEMAVTFSAARIGRIDMAVGNIFGSNIFNMMILPISSIFFWNWKTGTYGNFWGSVSPENIYLVIIVFLVTNMVALDLIIRTKLKKKGISFFTIATLLVWIAGLVLVFAAKP